MASTSLFSNQVAVLATMHQKERVIAPIFEKELGIKVTVPENFNTDSFGTFTREIKRVGNQIEAGRLKAKKAIEITGATLAIASEGSFAPHPNIPYLASNREIVIFIDQENDLEIIGEEFSTETNHNHMLVQNIEQALKFAEKVGFPEHGLVVMFEELPQNSSEIIKGITTEKQLIDAINYVLQNSPHGKAHIETDMRAMYNPTRMQNIAKATQNLVRKINSLCPNCSTPGFDITRIIKGLPCGMCSLPTPLRRSVIYECQKCSHSQEKLFPDGVKYADPARCLYCNP
ncbi:MAG: hypothetical protein QNJ47_05985 [Nostocaceae cyanobacterium]|nr:hypothetical protein [Nostocaceae cyanobacterium]